MEGREVREYKLCLYSPVSKRGADPGSLWIKVKICLVQQMVRENVEKETGANKDGGQSKLAFLWNPFENTRPYLC